MSLLNKYMSKASLEELSTPESQTPTVDQRDFEIEAMADDAGVVVPDVRPVSVEELAEATEVVTELGRDALVEHHEVEKQEMALTQADEEIASVEEFVSCLQHGLKTKSFSPAFIAVANSKLEKLGATFNVETPSLENYGSDNMEALYTTSLESFNGVFKRLKDARKRITENLFGKSKKYGNAEQARKFLEALNTSCDAILASTKDDVTVSVSSNFTMATNFDNISNAVKNEIKGLTAIISGPLKEGHIYVGKILDAVDKAVVEGGEGKTAEIIKTTADLPLPSAKISEGMYGLDSGSSGLFCYIKAKEAGGTELRDRLKGLSRRAYPDCDITLVGGDKKFPVDLAEAKLIARNMKTLLALADKLLLKDAPNIAKLGGRLEDVANRARKTAAPTTWSENKDLNILVDESEKMVRYLNSTNANMAWVITTAVESIVSKLAKFK